MSSTSETFDRMICRNIFGLLTDKPDTFDATAALAQKAGITFAQFVMMTPFPGTGRFRALGESAPAESDNCCWSANHSLLADSCSHAAQDVYASSKHEFR
jgi:hypothetical protein